jgi:hypothetical protein
VKGGVELLQVLQLNSQTLTRLIHLRMYTILDQVHSTLSYDPILALQPD